jgi:hypothetical protein
MPCKYMEEWRYSSTILDLGSKIEVSGQLDTPAALSSGKELPVPVGLQNRPSHHCINLAVPAQAVSE